jgi:hypothetical protein
MRSLEPVEVTWVDHAFHNGDYREGKSGLVTVTSVGYLVREDKEEVHIAQSFGPDDDARPQEVLSLIAGCVLTITPLKRKEKK